MASPTDAEEYPGNVVHSHVACDASQAHSLEPIPPPPYSITDGIDQNCCPCPCALNANGVDGPVRHGQDTCPLCSKTTSTPPSYDALFSETCDHQRLPTLWACAIAVPCGRIARCLHDLLSRHKTKDGYELLEMGHARSESLPVGATIDSMAKGKTRMCGKPGPTGKRWLSSTFRRGQGVLSNARTVTTKALAATVDSACRWSHTVKTYACGCWPRKVETPEAKRITQLKARRRKLEKEYHQAQARIQRRIFDMERDVWR